MADPLSCMSGLMNGGYEGRSWPSRFSCILGLMRGGFKGPGPSCKQKAHALRRERSAWVRMGDAGTSKQLCRKSVVGLGGREGCK